MIPSLSHCLCKASQSRLLSTAAVMSERRLRLVSPSAEMSSGRLLHVPWRWGKTVSVQWPRVKRDVVISGSMSLRTLRPSFHCWEPTALSSIYQCMAWPTVASRTRGLWECRWHAFRSSFDQYVKTSGLSFLQSAEPSYMESLIY